MYRYFGDTPLVWVMISGRFGLSLAFGLLCGCRTPPPSPARAMTTNETRLERIIVARDGKGFVTVPSGRSFHPWGMNYGNGGRLIEDFWDTEWDTVRGDFRELKDMGANVVRVSLQYGRFMESAERPDPAAFERLEGLARLAEETGLYLDLTGLGCYRPSDVPAWYDALDESDRWKAQAAFWSHVAEHCASSPAIFCYDLVNEPLSPAERREPGRWASGSRFGDMDFLQYIALDPAGRKREEIAAQWIRRMTRSIRERDTVHLITVGLLPWSYQWHHLSGFLPRTVAPEMDFLSVHIYPDKTKPEEAIAGLRHFAVGKPIVIEETFPLNCDTKQLEAFLRDSRKWACGWMGHYDGAPPDELDSRERSGQLTIAQSIYREWLRLFVRLTPEFSR